MISNRRQQVILVAALVTVACLAFCPRSAGAASGVPSPSARVSFKTTAVTDEQTGLAAFTMLIPSDWQLTGGVIWRLHPQRPATGSFQVQSPDGMEEFDAFPDQPFAWTANPTIASMFPPGSNYLGNEVEPPATNALEALRTVVIPRFRSGLDNLRIVSTEPVPALAAATRAEVPVEPDNITEVSAGKMVIEYELNGVAMEEDIYCSMFKKTMKMNPTAFWVLDKIFSCRTPKGKMDEMAPIFVTMITSLHVTLPFVNRVVQVMQFFTQYTYDQIRLAGEISRIIANTNGQISDAVRSVYENRQRAFDRANEKWDQYIRGVDTYYDPNTGATVELPGANHVWTDGNGNYMPTETGDNPGGTEGGNWTELQQPPAGE